MAINLNFQAAPISTFAKQSPQQAAQGVLQVGQALSGAVEKMGNVYEAHQELRDEREIMRTNVGLEEMESERAKRLDTRAYFSGEELEGTGYKGQKYEVDADGRQVAKQIPAWEARPYIERQERLKDLEMAASGISHWTKRQKFLADGRKRIENQFQVDQANAEQEARAQIRWEYTQEFKALMDERKYKEAEFLLSESNVFTAEEKSEWFARFAEDSEISEVQDILLREDFTEADIVDAEAQIEYLSSDGDEEYRGPLDEPTRLSLIAALKRKLASEAAKRKAGRSQQDARWIMETKERISNKDPSVNAEYLLRGVDEGRVTVGGAVSMFGQILDDAKEQNERNIRMQTLARQSLMGVGIEPTSKNKETINDIYNGALNEAVQEKLLAGQEFTNEDAIRVVAGVAKTYNIMPPDAVGSLVALNRSDPAGLLAGAELVNTIKEVAPESFGDITRADTKTVVNTAAALDMKMPPADAVRYATGIRDQNPLEAEQYNLISGEWTKQPAYGASKTAQSLDEKMRDDPLYNTGWFGLSTVNQQPAVGYANDPFTGMPNDMLIEYNQLFRAQLVVTKGNPDIAAQNAYDILKTKWRPTTINYPNAERELEFLGINKFAKDEGAQLMAYPPDSIPGATELTPIVMRNDITKLYGDQLKEGEYLVLTSDTVTNAEGDSGRPISYPVYAVGKDGPRQLLNPIDALGGSARYTYNEERAMDTWRQSVDEKREAEILEKMESQMRRIDYYDAELELQETIQSRMP